jgi:hypothetical protein
MSRTNQEQLSSACCRRPVAGMRPAGLSQVPASGRVFSGLRQTPATCQPLRHIESIGFCVAALICRGHSENGRPDGSFSLGPRNIQTILRHGGSRSATTVPMTLAKARAVPPERRMTIRRARTTDSRWTRSSSAAGANSIISACGPRDTPYTHDVQLPGMCRIADRS